MIARVVDHVKTARRPRQQAGEARGRGCIYLFHFDAELQFVAGCRHQLRFAGSFFQSADAAGEIIVHPLRYGRVSLQDDGVAKQQSKEHDEAQNRNRNKEKLCADGSEQPAFGAGGAIREQQLLVIGHQADGLLAILNLLCREFRMLRELHHRIGQVRSTCRKIL